MRLSQVDLNLFLVFDAVYSKRNLTRAAEVLHITQPAVSNALGRMRKSFDDPLFVSTSGGMVPTPVAENIHIKVREALQLLDSSLHENDRFIPAQSDKTFRLSMNDLAESLLLPPLTDILHRSAPHIHLECYYTPRPDMARELAAGHIDLAVDAPLVNDPQLHHTPVMKMRFVCMVSKHHPWVGDTLSMEDYLQLGHIHVSSRRHGEGIVDNQLGRLGKQRAIQVRVQHYRVAPLIAMRSHLALTGPEYLLQNYDAKLLELPFTLPVMESHLYWHRSADQDQANRWMRAQMAMALVQARG